MSWSHAALRRTAFLPPGRWQAVVGPGGAQGRTFEWRAEAALRHRTGLGAEAADPVAGRGRLGTWRQKCLGVEGDAEGI